MSNQYLDDLIGTQVGDYTIQELIGEGTFSMVYRGVDKLGKNVKAIKIPRAYTKDPRNKIRRRFSTNPGIYKASRSLFPPGSLSHSHSKNSSCSNSLNSRRGYCKY